MCVCIFSGASSAQTYNFTNAGANGREGPTQSEVNSAYSGTNLENKVTIQTRGIQEWVVPASGNYKVEAWGASGGDSGNFSGGRGAKIEGTFYLNSNETIKILVGQVGLDGVGTSQFSGASGGGGTFVIKDPYSTNESILVVAGGGGGAACYTSYNTEAAGQDALTTNTAGSLSENFHGLNGNGGESDPWHGWHGGTGGAGFFGNGVNNSAGSSSYGPSSSPGSSFVNGGMGGNPGTNSKAGGFGGGGTGGFTAGGGGGYSGGAAGKFKNLISSKIAGGGGGSFNSGTNQVDEAGANEGNGKVIITFTAPPSYTFTNAGATGRSGPSQSQINLSYAGTNLENNVTIQTEGIQEWAVPLAGSYKIEVFGASGGSSTYGAGGKGAYMSGKFILEESQLLKIIAGQTGIGNSNGGGGGGGSFVVNGVDSTLLIAAGGGGGAGGYLETTINPHLQDGKDAVSGTSGTDAQTQGPGSGFTSLGQGGSTGNGGSGGISNHPGGGGAGFLTDGTLGQNTAGYHAFAGVSFSNGFVGGDGRGKPNGGFGGGGSTSHGGGGGGGYSGGGGGVWTHPGGADWGHGGGGGGSYNSGTDQNNTSGENIGHGKVIITFLASANEAPVLSQGTGPVSKVTSEDTLTTWSASELNATDSDTNASQLSWSVLTPPSNGTALVDGNGTSPQTVTYLPYSNYHGSDSFSVMVSDGDKNDSLTINLTINQINDSTIISGDFNSTIDSGTVALGDLNASDPDGLTDGSYFSVSQNPSHGNALVDQIDGNWTYIPQSNFFGDDNFTVTIADDLNQSTTQLIKISIIPTSTITYSFTNGGSTGRQGPTQDNVNSSYSGTNLDGIVTVNTRGIQEWIVPASGIYRIEAWGASGGDGGDKANSGNDGNYSGGLGAKMSGDFSLSAGEKLYLLVGQQGLSHYNYNGSGGGGSFVAKGTLLTNTTPLLVAGGGGGGGIQYNQNATTSESGLDAKTNNGANSTGGSNGQGGQGGTSQGSGGGGGFFGDGYGTAYSPSYHGKSFRNGGLGGNGNSNLGDGGFGGGGGFHWNHTGGGGGGGYSGGAGGGNYHVPTYTGGGGGSFNTGSNQLNSVGANQGHGKIMISIFSSSPTNKLPVIFQGNGPIIKVTYEDTLTIWASNELNATDPDTHESKLSWTLLTPPSNGTAVVEGNGTSPQTFTFQPNANYHGNDSFSVMVSDGDANDSITINLTINPTEDPAIIYGDFNQSIPEDVTAHGDINASDIDGLSDGSYYAINTPPSHGSASIDPTNGNWSYLPHHHFFGDDNFTISITDDLNQSYFEIIEVFVHPVDDPAIIYGDFNQSIPEDVTAYGDINASDIDGLSDGSYYAINTPPSHGSASIDPINGNWSYLPHPHFFGDDNFTISITDDLNQSYFEIIEVFVHPVDDPAIIYGDFNQSIQEDNIVFGDINASDVDGLTDGSYYAITTPPSHGNANIDPTEGNWTYLPHPNFFGDDNFTISITDDLNHSYLENIQLLVHPVDDPAIISGDLQATTYLDISSHGQIIAKDIDGLAKDIIFEISRLPKKGIAEIDPIDGNWTYFPSHQDFGDDMFEISVTDIDGNKTFQTINLNAQINHPLLKTITPILSAEEAIILQGEVISTGGSIVLDTGFWLDTSPTFSNPNKIYSVADKNGSLKSAISLPREIVYIKTFAITSMGEFFGQTIRYNPFSSKKFWQAHAIPMDADWMQSAWFGMFTPVTDSWIYHLRMEWLFISDFTPKNLWVWSEQQEWIWTTGEVFPFFYSNNTGNWLYLLPTKLGDKTFYNYETEELE